MILGFWWKIQSELSVSNPLPEYFRGSAGMEQSFFVDITSQKHFRISVRATSYGND